jgi:hypothetical protein
MEGRQLSENLALSSWKRDFLIPPFRASLQMEINELSGLRALVHENRVTDVKFQVYQLHRTGDTGDG